MFKKMLLCSILLAFSSPMIHSAEHDGYKIIQRPLKEALVAGFRNGGRHALGFSSPIILIGILKNYSSEEALAFPSMVGIFGAATGSALGGISSLLPMRKDGIEKMLVRENFIKRAAIVGAHTGTSVGTAAFMAFLFFHLHGPR